jgi:hypothetical protein
MGAVDGCGSATVGGGLHIREAGSTPAYGTLKNQILVNHIQRTSALIPQPTF